MESVPEPPDVPVTPLYVPGIPPVPPAIVSIEVIWSVFAWSKAYLIVLKGWNCEPILLSKPVFETHKTLPASLVLHITSVPSLVNTVPGNPKSNLWEPEAPLTTISPLSDNTFVSSPCAKISQFAETPGVEFVWLCATET